MTIPMVLFQVYELIIRVVAKAAPRARARVRVECLVDFVRRRSPKQNKNKQEGGKKKRYSVWMLLRWARPALVRASHIFLSFVSPCQLPCGINRYGMEWVDFLRLLFFAPRFFCVFSQCFFWGGFSCFVFCFSFWLFGFYFGRRIVVVVGDIIITRGRLILAMMRCAYIFFGHQAAYILHTYNRCTPGVTWCQYL